MNPALSKIYTELNRPGNVRDKIDYRKKKTGHTNIPLTGFKKIN